MSRYEIALDLILLYDGKTVFVMKESKSKKYRYMFNNDCKGERDHKGK